MARNLGVAVIKKGARGFLPSGAFAMPSHHQIPCHFARAPTSRVGRSETPDAFDESECLTWLDDENHSGEGSAQRTQVSSSRSLASLSARAK